MSDYVKDLINNIADGNLESAEQDFNAAFSDKVSSALENIRVSVASKLTDTNEETQLREGASPFKKGHVLKHRIGLSDGSPLDKITLTSDETKDKAGKLGHHYKCGSTTGFAYTSSLKRSNKD